MTFPYEKEVNDMMARINGLQHQLEIISDKLRYGETMPASNDEFTDGRAASLKIMLSDLGINLILIDLLVNVGTSNKTKVRAHERYYSNATDYLRLALATIFQFRLENMVTNILAQFDKSAAANLGYTKKVETLYDILAQDYVVLKERRERNFKVLMVLPYIRNSLHNNGYHKHEPLSITIYNVQFNFRKNGQVLCAGWKHILIAIEATLNIVEKMLNSPKVKAIPPGQVPTYFVSERLARD